MRSGLEHPRLHGPRHRRHRPWNTFSTVQHGLAMFAVASAIRRGARRLYRRTGPRDRHAADHPFHAGLAVGRNRPRRLRGVLRGRWPNRCHRMAAADGAPGPVPDPDFRRSRFDVGNCTNSCISAVSGSFSGATLAIAATRNPESAGDWPRLKRDRYIRRMTYIAKPKFHHPEFPRTISAIPTAITRARSRPCAPAAGMTRSPPPSSKPVSSSRSSRTGWRRFPASAARPRRRLTSSAIRTASIPCMAACRRC